MRKKVWWWCWVAGLVVGWVGQGLAEPLEVGFGKAKVNGLMQWWYQNDNGAKPYDTFRLRRAEIKLSGEIKPEVVWAVMIDPAQVREDDVTKAGANVTSVGRKSVLQDFVIGLKHKYCSIDFGQYKVPFGMEGLESSSKLDFIERSTLASQFKWADYRDLGLTVKGDYKVGGMKIQPALGLFNGESQNKLDANNPLDLVGRLVISPLDILQFGLAQYSGKTGAAETENIRTGLEVKFVQEPFSAYGEYNTGKAGGKNKAAYYATFTYKFLKSYQAGLRYDSFDPDTDVAKDAGTEITVGLNYFIEKHNSKIQLNYVLRGEEGTAKDNDVLRLNIQVAY